MRFRESKRSKQGDARLAALHEAAHRLGWETGPNRTELIGIVARRLQGKSDPVVAVVSEDAEPGLAEVLRIALPRARVTVLLRGDGIRQLHLALAATGPQDLVVDLSRRGAHDQRFSVLLLHLCRGGALVSRLPQRKGPIHALLNEVKRLRENGAPPPPRTRREWADDRPWTERDVAALVNSIEELVVRRKWVIAVNGVTTSAVVREEDMERYLELRGGPDRVLTTIPGERWISHARLRASCKESMAAFSREHNPLAVSLRVHHDVVCAPAQIAVREDIVLPATYRHFRKSRLTNRSLVGWTAGFVRTPDLNAPTLPGRWFYLDNQHRGHFGHAMTEQISQLWAWSEAKQRHPDLRALVFLNRGRRLASWEYELLAAGGIPRDDIVMAEHPVRVESLFTATPMFSMSAQLHPEIASTWATIGEALAARASDRSYPDRIFCTRRLAKRACHNVDEVEEFFRVRGFEVVVPEENSLPDQVRLFRQASVIAGFAGSGMFQLALTGGPRHAILVSSESYTARNEYMISSVLGHRHDIAVCRADTPHPHDQWSSAAYKSDFTFDPQREGVFIDEVLAGTT